MKKKGTVISITLSIVLLITSLPLTWSGSSKAASDYGLENPKVAYLTRDIVEFGHYWQEDINGDGKADENDEKTPIRWQVLERNGDELLLLSDKILDYQQYNSNPEAITWELCSIRTWLNGVFYNNAFSTAEKKGIKECNIINPDNLSYGIDGGNNTKDRLFLLSLDEIKGYGFNESYDYRDQARQGKVTAHAKEKGLSANADGAGNWWLRSPGSYASNVAYVSKYGYVYSIGGNVTHVSGVRPALRINLSSISGYVKDAGKVNVVLKAASWDTIKFGNYGGNTLTWRVLKVNGNEALLLSENIVDTKKYNEEYTSVTWSSCTLRTWLNNDFYNSSFTSTQKNAIRSTTLVNSDNPYYGTSGGNNTSDKIYLLSLSEIINPEYGFPDAYYCQSEARTAYKAGSSGAGNWWLRSPGGYAGDASSVIASGNIYESGKYVDNEYGVRPVLHIDLSSSAWTKGDKIIAGDEEALMTAVQTPPPSPDPDPTPTPLPTRTPSSDNYGLENPKVAYLTRDIVEFGHYWQEDTNGDGTADENDERTPIRWQVLERNGDELFLLSEKVLDCQQYNSNSEATTWEMCSLRTWLNGEFYYNAFSSEERNGIKECNITNPDNSSAGTDGGNNTKDNLFLLSLDEINEYGFNDSYIYGDQARQGKGTAFAKEKRKPFAMSDGMIPWWLRSPGGNARNNATCVVESGYVDRHGISVSSSVYGVRPSLKINMPSVSEYVKNVGSDNVALKATAWDSLLFGNYGGETLVWRVLNVNDDEALLLSENIVDNNDYDAATWKESTLRTWLNNDFYNAAFSSTQRSAIRNTSLVNSSHPYWGTSGGDNTSDKIYLLSLSEITDTSYGFPDTYECYSDSRKACEAGNSVASCWWLRSPGGYEDNIAYVGSRGNVEDFGVLYDTYYGIRPALRIDLSSSVWTKGEKIIAGDAAALVTSIPSPTPTTTPTSSPNPTPTPTKTPTIPPTATPTPTATSTAPPTVVPDVTAVPDPTSNPNPTLVPGPTAVPEQPTEAPSSETSETGIPTAVPSDSNAAIQTSSPAGNIIYYNIYNTSQTPEKESGDNQYVKKGMKFFVGNLQYKVTSAKINQYEVSVIKVKNKKCKNITIETMVVYKGNNFKITGIGKKFAFGCTKLKKINIKSKYIKKIEKKAFTGIKSKYKILVVKSKLKKYAAMIKKAK